MSFKNTIKYYLEKNGYMTLQELESLCKSERHKMSYAERELRRLKAVTPEINLIKNSAGAIIAYKWKDTHSLDDCYSYQKFKTYCSECRKKVGVNNQRVLI